MTRTLRDYQREAVEATYADWAADPAPTAVVLPTGCGKSSIGAQIAVDGARAGERTLVLGEREDWLGNILKAVWEIDPTVTIGWAQADRIEARRQVIGGMVQTLQSARRRLQLLRPHRIIVDECDLAVAPRYRDIFAWADEGPDGPARRVGVTATMATATKPKRGQLGLGDVWPRVAFSRDIAWAIEQGWLVRPRGKVVVASHLDLSKVHTRGGDYQDGELGEMVAQDMPEIVAAWLTHGEDRITGAYWPTVAAAVAACEAFQAAGVKSELVTGTTPQVERDGIYGRLAAGTTRMMHSVGVATRGWDCPELACILMARPTKSTPLYQQIIGRGLRPAPWVGKDDCLVLDVVGASRVNGLATLLQLYRAAEVDDERPVPPVPCCRGCGVPLREAVERLGLLVPDVCEGDCPVPERDPDGGRRKLDGPATYVDHDLFQGPGLHWQTTRRRGRVFLAVADRFAILWPEPDGTWTAAHLSATGQTGDSRNPFGIVDLRIGVDMVEAKLVAEAWARTYGAADLAERLAERSSSRKAPAYLLGRAAKYRIAGAERMTAARVREEIDRAIASSRLDLL